MIALLIAATHWFYGKNAQIIKEIIKKRALKPCSGNDCIITANFFLTTNSRIKSRIILARKH